MSITRNFRFLRVVTNSPARCLFSSKKDSGTEPSKGTTTASSPPPPPATQKPAASNTVSDKYQCNEYYEHDEMSFYQWETSMSSKRVGQPSSKTK